MRPASAQTIIEAVEAMDCAERGIMLAVVDAVSHGATVPDAVAAELSDIETDMAAIRQEPANDDTGPALEELEDLAGWLRSALAHYQGIGARS